DVAGALAHGTRRGEGAADFPQVQHGAPLEPPALLHAAAGLQDVPAPAAGRADAAPTVGRGRRARHGARVLGVPSLAPRAVEADLGEPLDVRRVELLRAGLEQGHALAVGPEAPHGAEVQGPVALDLGGEVLEVVVRLGSRVPRAGAQAEL